MEKTQHKPSVMHSFKETSSKASSLPMKSIIIVLIIIALFGVGTGYILASILPGKGGSGSLTVMGGAAKGKTFGAGDSAVFKDTAEGILKEGGVEGEGQYHLVRPGGDSQNVYLTSSLVDLSQFINKKIKVWGETQKAQSAGWLMDVGKVEVL